MFMAVFIYIVLLIAFVAYSAYAIKSAKINEDNATDSVNLTERVKNANDSVD